MFDKRIILLLALFAFLCISSVNAHENTTDISDNNFTAIDDMSDMNLKENAINDEVNGNARDEVANQTVSNEKISNKPKSISITPVKLSTTYGSGKYFKVKVTDGKTKKAVPNVNLILKLCTGKKYKKVTVKTDSKGIAKYHASTLSVGTHKIVVKVKDSKKFTSKSKTSSVKISKVKLSISAPKITSYYKQNKKFRITVKNKESKKPMKNVKVKIKVYTGKKHKDYTLKTNKNGIITINTKSLTKGKHKVTIAVKSTSKVKSKTAKSSIKTIANSKYIKLKVNGHVLNVKLEKNQATKKLLDKLKKGNIKIHAEDYGNFEKVGNLGFSLPTNDKYITTSIGDIVLYDGDEISVFYNSNSWSYTKLGKIQNSKNLKDILGKGDITLVLSLK